MNQKLLMKVGIGAGVLVLGYLAYKKFMAKPAETKSAEAIPEEEVVVEAAAPAETPTAVAPKTKNVLKRDVAVKAEVVALPAEAKYTSQDVFLDKERLEKYGLTQSEFEKLVNESNRISNLQKANRKLSIDEKRAQLYDVLRKFGKDRNLNAEGFIKMKEAALAAKKERKAQTNMLTGKASFANFMDFDANNDALGSLM